MGERNVPFSRPVRGSLTQRLVILFTFILLVPTVLNVFLAWDAFSENTKRAKLSVRQFAILAATYERRFFDDTRRVLQRLANEPSVRHPDAGRCAAALRQVLNTSREFSNLVYSDADGQPVCWTTDSITKIPAQAQFQERSAIRDFSLSDYMFTADSPFPVIVATQPVFAEDGHLQGMLSASIELYWLTTFVHEARLPSDGVFFLLDSNGNVLANRALFFDNQNPALPKTESGASRNEALRSAVGEDLIDEVVSRRLVDFEAIGNDEVRRVYSSVALPHGNVTVLFGVPAATALGWIEKDLVTRILSVCVIWWTGIVVAWMGTRFLITRWIITLKRMAQAFAGGDYAVSDFKLNEAPGELRALGETMMLMAGRIEAREEELFRSVQQKDILLKEIHHRVKNNLQIVSSLLNIHGKAVSEPTARNALDDVKTRVRALALVHRYLYEADDVRMVPLQMFMTELCRTLVNSLSDAKRRIALRVDIPEVTIVSDWAVPVALLVTEAITNAMKHAFPGGRSGTIAVRLAMNTATGQAVLIVSDDGVGPPVTDRDEHSRQLGLHLIQAFARQIGGELSISGPPGMTIKVRFAIAEPSGDGVRQRDAVALKGCALPQAGVTASAA
jgi:two-component sensor histidine kinase